MNQSETDDMQHDTDAEADRAAAEAALADALGVTDQGEPTPEGDAAPAQGERVVPWAEFLPDLVAEASALLSPNWTGHLVGVALAWCPVLEKHFPNPPGGKYKIYLIAAGVTFAAVKELRTIPPRNDEHSTGEGAPPSRPLRPDEPSAPGAVVGSVRGV